MAEQMSLFNEEDFGSRTPGDLPRFFDGPAGVRVAGPGVAQDFGEKIGGARKDVWRRRGLVAEDLGWMNDAERRTLVKKANVWKKPDYQALYDSGIPREVVYFYKRVRDAMPTKPAYHSTIEDSERVYIDFVREMQDVVMSCRSMDDVLDLNDYFVRTGRLVSTGGLSLSRAEDDPAARLIDNRLLKGLGEAYTRDYFERTLSRDVRRKRFLYGPEELAEERRARARRDYVVLRVSPETAAIEGGRLRVRMSMGTWWVYPPEGVSVDELAGWDGWAVAHGGRVVGERHPTEDEAREARDALVEEQVEAEGREDAGRRGGGRKMRYRNPVLDRVERRGGDDVRRGRHVSGEGLIGDFGIRGGEFGNWMTGDERTKSLDMTYDSLHDLAVALNVRDEDVSLNGRLALAFGSRGRGGASGGVAHYEPMREVINLTRMRGAGSLAHEWWHALDDVVGKELGFGGIGDGRYRPYDAGRPNPFWSLIDAMHFRQVPADEARQAAMDAVTGAWDALEAVVGEWAGRAGEAGASAREGFEKVASEFGRGNGLPPRGSGDTVPHRRLSSLMSDGVWRPLVEGLGDDYEAITEMTTAFREAQEALRTAWGDLAAKEATRGPSRETTEFYKDATALDAMYAKAGHGYWSSDIELLARAGAAWVHDELAARGIRNDYLTGHAGDASRPSVRPLGRDMEEIGDAFASYVDWVKQHGILMDRDAQVNEVTSGANEVRTVIWPAPGGTWSWGVDRAGGDGERPHREAFGNEGSRDVALARAGVTAEALLATPVRSPEEATR